MKLTVQDIGTRVEVIVTGSEPAFVAGDLPDSTRQIWVYADPDEALADAKALGNAAAAAIKYREARDELHKATVGDRAEADEVEALIKKWIAATDTVDTARIRDLEQIYMPLAMEIVAARHQAARTPIADADAHADKIGFDVGGAMLKAMEDKEAQYVGPPLTGRYVFERGDRVVLKATNTAPARAAQVVRDRMSQDPGYLIKLEHNGAVMRARWEEIRLAFPDEIVPPPPLERPRSVYFEMGERVLTANLTGPENVGFVTELPSPENGGAYTVKISGSGRDVRCLGEEMRRYSARNFGTGPAMDLRPTDGEDD